MVPSSQKSQWWNWVARQRIDPHLPIHGLRDSFGTWVYEEYGVKQAQEWLGHSDPATTLRHYVRLTTAARAKAVAGLDKVTRAALEAAERRAAADAGPALDNVVALTSRRRGDAPDQDSAGSDSSDSSRQRATCRRLMIPGSSISEPPAAMSARALDRISGPHSSRTKHRGRTSHPAGMP